MANIDLLPIKTQALSDGVDCREIVLDSNYTYNDVGLIFNQLESNSRFLKITFMIGGRQVLLDSTIHQAHLFLQKPDGKNIIKPCYIDDTEHVIYCEIDTQAIIVNGVDRVQIALLQYNSSTEKSSTIISTEFSIIINKCVVDSDVISTDETYQTFIMKLNDMNVYDSRLATVETNKLDKTGDSSNTTALFTQSSTLANIITGEKIGVMLGKIAKGLTDLIAHITNTNNPHNVQNVLSATKWTTARTLSLTSDVTGSVSVDGSTNASIATTLVNVGTAGTYTKVTTDAKGRVTSGSNPTTLSGYGITDATPSSHVGSTGLAHGVATESVNGFMSSGDKTKLDKFISGSVIFQQTSATGQDVELATIDVSTPLNATHYFIQACNGHYELSKFTVTSCYASGVTGKLYAHIENGTVGNTARINWMAYKI